MSNLCVFFISKYFGIGIVPYSPLGRGFFGGKGVVESLASNSALVYIFTNIFSHPFFDYQ